MTDLAAIWELVPAEDCSEYKLVNCYYWEFTEHEEVYSLVLDFIDEYLEKEESNARHHD